jgi:hypothetical protein
MEDDSYSSSDESLTKADNRDIVESIIQKTMPAIIAEITKQVTLAMAPVTAMPARIETLEKLTGQGGGASLHAPADRKKNLLIYGLDEPTTGKETPPELRQTLKSLAVEIGYKDLDYNEAFRLGKVTALNKRQI